MNFARKFVSPGGLFLWLGAVTLVAIGVSIVTGGRAGFISGGLALATVIWLAVKFAVDYTTNGERITNEEAERERARRETRLERNERFFREQMARGKNER